MCKSRLRPYKFQDFDTGSASSRQYLMQIMRSSVPFVYCSILVLIIRDKLVSRFSMFLHECCSAKKISSFRVYIQFRIWFKYLEETKKQRDKETKKQKHNETKKTKKQKTKKQSNKVTKKHNKETKKRRKKNKINLSVMRTNRTMSFDEWYKQLMQTLIKQCKKYIYWLVWQLGPL